jgi:hypothetical protein
MADAAETTKKEELPCVCGEECVEDPEMFFIACDRCDTWSLPTRALKPQHSHRFHGPCVNVDEDEGSDMDFICSRSACSSTLAFSLWHPSPQLRPQPKAKEVIWSHLLLCVCSYALLQDAKRLKPKLPRTRSERKSPIARPRRPRAISRAKMTTPLSFRWCPSPLARPPRRRSGRGPRRAAMRLV